MDQILSRYGYSSATGDQRQREQQLLLCSSQENGAVLRRDDSMKSELERLQLAIERLKGKALDGMSFSDLITLENQLNDSLHSVKDQKTQILLNQVERSRLQEKRALEENQILRKQVEMLGRGSKGMSEIPQFSSPQAEAESSSSDDDENDNEEHHSDTSLQLGLSSSGYSTKRKKPKVELICDNSGSQVASD
ncbi:hypothetical protein EUTSA_v10006251mg [Eutrema salsugineum]|uniref:K-box domain-containing protein n=2 Tax=Eutrema salsugineum TaxID=72664 RepID=V4NE45_EUTSA|nr:hypothetical protein EUTSA_v10006251mg [Eutrema salsugineum]